jgi:hypothetical protein
VVGGNIVGPLGELTLRLPAKGVERHVQAFHVFERVGAEEHQAGVRRPLGQFDDDDHRDDAGDGPRANQDLLEPPIRSTFGGLFGLPAVARALIWWALCGGLPGGSPSVAGIIAGHGRASI